MAQANSGDFRGPEARLSFSDGLWEPVSQGNDSGELKYGCTLIFPAKERPSLLNPVKKVVHMKWGDKGLADFDKGLIKNPIFEGDGPQAYSKQSGELWAGFGPGLIFIRCKNNDDSPPRVLWRSRHVEATKDEVYSGCYGYPVLNAYSWEHPVGGRGVTFNIRLFQKSRDDVSLGGRSPVDVDKWYVDIPDDDDDQGDGGGQGSVNIFD